MAAFPQSLTYPNFGFDILARDQNSFARLGKISTPHGTIETPNFIFVGTKATVKNLHPAQMREAGADMILSNTYHLYIQPGPDLVQKMGGLHKFMGWDGPMLTDSGGFQIFSLGTGSGADEIKGKGKSGNKSLIRIDEQDGAIFKSYKDGSICRLNPEISMDVQRKLGADFVVQMDECTPQSADRDYTEKSMQMSHRWGDRSLTAFEQTHDGTQAVYGVVQGGVYRDLREESADYTASRPFFGTAVGGCLGGTKVHFYEILSWLPKRLHPERPVHLLGIGKIEDIFEGVKSGMDTFDCVTPTREARHGRALMKGARGGFINLLNSRFKDDPNPLDETLGLASSALYSRAYIHHLLKAGEMLVFQILSQHNVAVISRLMREIRATLKNGGDLNQLQKEWLSE
ncbi:MAG: tRNA guanosine(34) transglycosylase Tgt [Alphaproteobacteria bacterium]|nr:tRNA guanosine(34) transglycosylase Tgt [Alphaproteobacteria bacterium]